MAHPLDPIRAAAAKYPGAKQAFRFGDHEVFHVKEKVFVWLGDDEDPKKVYVSVKLKDTMTAALMLPGVEPASYGMHKYGWIGARFPKNGVPVDMVLQWLEESYRHTAPKTLLKQLDGGAATTPAPNKARPKSKPKTRARR